MNERITNRALRPCRRALQNHNIEGRQTTRRAFSSTTQSQSQLPTFNITPTNEPLTTLLTELRRKVFIPAALNRPQRNLVFRTRHHAMLLSDPVTVEVGGEDHTLEPLDVTKDIPDSWKSLQQAMDLMGTSKADWTNFPTLLAAMKRAGRKWKVWQWERIIRKAGDMGMVAEVLQALRQVDNTGLVLSDTRLVREVMWACREKAVASGWAKEETEQALRFAEQAAEMLEHKIHSGTFTANQDPRTKMDVLGCVLELAAIRAQKHHNGEDKEGKVEMYAARLAPNLKRIKTLGLVESGEGLLAARADYELLRLIPVRDGLEIASQVLGGKLDQFPNKLKWDYRRADLKKLCSDAAELVEAADEANKGKRKGLKWFREAEARV